MAIITSTYCTQAKWHKSSPPVNQQLTIQFFCSWYLSRASHKSSSVAIRSRDEGKLSQSLRRARDEDDKMSILWPVLTLAGNDMSLLKVVMISPIVVETTQEMMRRMRFCWVICIIIYNSSRGRGSLSSTVKTLKTIGHSCSSTWLVG